MNQQELSDKDCNKKKSRQLSHLRASNSNHMKPFQLSEYSVRIRNPWHEGYLNFRRIYVFQTLWGTHNCIPSFEGYN